LLIQELKNPAVGKKKVTTTKFQPTVWSNNYVPIEVNRTNKYETTVKANCTKIGQERKVRINTTKRSAEWGITTVETNPKLKN